MKRRILYVPGLFMLALIPVIFFLFTEQKIRETTLRVVEIRWTDTMFMKSHPEYFIQYKNKFVPERNYLEINISGNKKEDEIKLAFAQDRLKELLKINDTLNGIHFKFLDNSTYGNFVEAINILQKENAETYMFLDNDLWVYQFPKLELYFSIPNSGGCIIYSESSTSWWKVSSENILNVINGSWQIILLFPSLLILIQIIKHKHQSIG